MKPALYEISTEILEILQSEVWGEEEEQRIEELNLVFEQKADGITRFCDNLDMAIDAIKKEEERLAARRKSLSNRKDALNNSLLRSMKAIDRTEIDLITRVIKTQKNPPSVVVDDESLIPAKFFTVIPATTRLDKTMLKKALKDGDIKGAHLEQSERLVIK